MEEESNPELRILVVDDDASLRRSLELNLEHAGYQVVGVASATDARAKLQEDAFEIVLTDFRLPDNEGLSFIEQCSADFPESAVILMTGFGNHDLALDAMRKGAYDYISKPFEVDELVFMLRKIEERETLRAENEALRSEVDQKFKFSNIIAKSKVMNDVFDTVKRLSNFNTTVLIVGESGTGKELIARALHYNSPRKGKPFVAINCGAIPESLMESELFGHKKGAFTDATRDKKGLFEEASGGTIFLDEIGEMPTHLQVKLLRALQEQAIRPVGDEKTVSVDVRVIAATLRDLEEDVENGRFRDDLYYRLNVVTIHLPPLRDRQEDIPLLVKHFMKKHNKRLGLSIKNVDGEALGCLMEYDWRGNVRELENCVERALVLTEADSINADALPSRIRACGEKESIHSLHAVEDGDLSIKKRTRALEVELILKALEQTDGNRTHAAKVLEISHRALLYKLKEYGIGKK